MSEASIKTIKMWDIIKQKKSRFILTVGMMIEFIALQLAPTRFKPDAIIAGLPVYNVQKEGHAASDEILKYRSMGTIFLAHQKGGKRTFKCTLKINGPSRLYVLSFFQFLQKNGMQENFTLNEFSSKFEIPLTSSIDPFTPPTANSKIRYIQDYEHIGEEQVAYHKTVPIITETKIYTNMYLETVRYTEDVKLGMNTMEIDLAFREFIPPMHIQYYKGDPSKKERGYYSSWVTEEERDALRRIDLLINSFWALRSFFDEALHPDIQQKQSGQYAIEGSILFTGAVLASATIWRK